MKKAPWRGASEMEVLYMEDGSARRNSEALLKSLRVGTSHYRSFITRIKKDVKLGGLTLGDIGTSEEELEQLRILGCKCTAQIHLDHLRLGSTQYEKHLRELLAELRKGKLQLDSIGTSIEELEQLRTLGCTKSSRRWLKLLRNCSRCPANQRILFRKRLYAELKTCKLLPEDIGTSNNELDFLVGRPRA